LQMSWVLSLSDPDQWLKSEEEKTCGLEAGLFSLELT
jgi:hypothetical protein